MSDMSNEKLIFVIKFCVGFITLLLIVMTIMSFIICFDNNKKESVSNVIIINHYIKDSSGNAVYVDIHTLEEYINPTLQCDLFDITVEGRSDCYVVTEEFMETYYYFAQCVEAEAGTQSTLGKEYVVDVILNRVDSDEFPDTINDVINQTGQFSVVENGSINCCPSDESFYAIASQLNDRIDSDILFFQTGGYHSGRTPCFQQEDHYFSC